MYLLWKLLNLKYVIINNQKKFIMNKNKLLIVASMVMAISFQSCRDNVPPSNPYNGQVYKDDNDNTWTWNQAMGCWMIMSAMNNMNSGGHYYYYPSNNRWTNSSGVSTNPPSYVSTKTTSSINKDFSEKSYKANSKSSTSTTGSKLDFTKKSSSNSTKKSGGFGSSFKPSHS
jgi:hypothetical protein